MSMQIPNLSEAQQAALLRQYLQGCVTDPHFGAERYLPQNVTLYTGVNADAFQKENSGVGIFTKLLLGGTAIGAGVYALKKTGKWDTVVDFVKKQLENITKFFKSDKV